jgi:hypothetical protein
MSFPSKRALAPGKVLTKMIPPAIISPFIVVLALAIKLLDTKQIHKKTTKNFINILFTIYF